jgi:hypothetical protein
MGYGSSIGIITIALLWILMGPVLGRFGNTSTENDRIGLETLAKPC